MARQARIVIPDVPHHVTQRGNNRQDVFFTDDDRRLYLAVLQERCAAAGVRVLGAKQGQAPSSLGRSQEKCENR